MFGAGIDKHKKFEIQVNSLELNYKTKETETTWNYVLYNGDTNSWG